MPTGNGDRVEDRAAGRGERAGERGRRVDAGPVILVEDEGGLDAFARRPLRERLRQLRHRVAEAHGVGIALEDVRRRGVHDQQRFLGRRRNALDGHRVRREQQPQQHVDVILHDQFGRDAARDVGRESGIVAPDHLDLAARPRRRRAASCTDRCRVEQLPAQRRRAGITVDHSDAQRRLLRRRGGEAG